MQPEARFAKIEAILEAMAERMAQAERRMDRADQRMDRSEQRMDRAEKRMEKVDRRMEKFDERMDRAEQRMDRAEQRMDRAEQRMEKFDQRLEVTRRLVQLGMKLVIQNNRFNAPRRRFWIHSAKAAATDTSADAYRPSVNFTSARSSSVSPRHAYRAPATAAPGHT
jgi:chromosome segregation ATPase